MAPAAQKRLQGLRLLGQSLRAGFAQLSDTETAVKSIVRTVVEADQEPLVGHAWELLARRLRADLTRRLSDELQALAQLQRANRQIEAAVDLMGQNQPGLLERTCQLAEDAVRQHLGACAQRLTLIAQAVNQVGEVRLGLAAA